MHRLQQLTSGEWVDLEQRARGACLVFNDALLPTGCQPARARIGIESSGGVVRLLVAYGVRSPDPALEPWLAHGERTFDSFEAFGAWLDQLALPAATPPSDRPERRVGAGTSITDVPAVQRLREQQREEPRVDAAAILDGLREEVRGQDVALTTVSRRVAAHLARTAPMRPLTMFLCGTTGVGKTKTAECLRDVLRGVLGDDAVGYLRLDMSEFQEAHRVSQLVGSPQGYVGYGDGAELVTTLRRQPRTIVLFDEIEKAHPSILTFLMNAMDAGRLTSPTAVEGSHTVDCRRSLFLFTTNAAAEETVRELDAADRWEDPHHVNEVCRRALRKAGILPELVGRISAFACYRPLSADNEIEIAARAVVSVGREYGLTVSSVAPTVVASILEAASHGTFGARVLEYAADALLSDAFVAARHAGVSRPCVVVGPPFSCSQGEEARASPRTGSGRKAS